MKRTLSITFEGSLYDADEVEDTAREFGDVARIRVTHRGGGAVVRIEADGDEIDDIAGSLMNIALARTIEVRS
jgi:hypothetical protein